MIDTWNPAKLNEKISGRDSWNPAILNEAVTDRDSWNPAILNESAGDTPVVFEATITATFPEGATCTATDGTTTLTADDNPMAFSIPNEGTWTVACVANGVTLSEDVVITTNGQTETADLTPVGATVTPTDSVPMLIACAGIGDSEITTIAGALADVDTLTAILESENAIDYLVRSTTFANAVTADSVAMTGIGAINYDADTLLADSTWSTAICNSTYFESVLNLKVPVMTSNTTPNGECIGFSMSSPEGSYSTITKNNDTGAYLAFDNDTTTYPVSRAAYDFGSEVLIKKVSALLNASNVTCEVWASNSETTGYVKINTFTYSTALVSQSSNIESDTKYRYWVIVPINQPSFRETQFYGRQDVE